MENYYGAPRPLASSDWEALVADSGDRVTLRRTVEPPAELDLNMIAAVIWSLCDGNRTVMDIQEVLCTRYPGNEMEVRRSVVVALRELLDCAAVTVPGHDLPPVSCMCLTYGRPRLLEEAIESFLRQDYLGPKELVILNDHTEQELCFDDPEVRVINMPARFRTLGEKRNACAALCHHDILFVWDDDDIYLPHRVSLSVSYLNDARDYFKPVSAFFWQYGNIEKLTRNLFHSQSCWRRGIFDQVNGYPHTWSGEDLALEQKFRKLGASDSVELEPPANFYIYRWAGTGSYHISGFGESNVAEAATKLEEWTQQASEQHSMPLGRIILEPKWRQDYEQQAATFISGSLGH
jgi:hypothetical protein